jgi:carbonic anhydrase
MFDLIYRFDSTNHVKVPPPNAQAALRRLEQGNVEFARSLGDLANGTPGARVMRFEPEDLGIAGPDGTPPVQEPFAAVLGCADARVPIEMIFSQASNDLFVVRVAGNILGAECLGSLDYALAHLGKSLRLFVVLGHSGCGAVTAAVDAFLNPGRYLQVASSHPLRAIVDRVFVAVRTAHTGLEAVYGSAVESKPGYRQALIETSVALNAAMTAATIRQEFRDRLGEREVVYGVYNLVSGRVKLALEPETGVAIRLAAPPPAGEGFDNLAALVAGSAMVRDYLEGGGGLALRPGSPDSRKTISLPSTSH